MTQYELFKSIRETIESENYEDLNKIKLTKPEYFNWVNDYFEPYNVNELGASSFTQINRSLMSAGQVFGGSPLYIFRRITLPLIAKGIVTGWMMTFIISFRELVTASLIAPPNTLVISTYIVREFEQGSVSVGMAMAVLCVLFTTTALLILNTVIARDIKK